MNYAHELYTLCCDADTLRALLVENQNDLVTLRETYAGQVRRYHEVLLTAAAERSALISVTQAADRPMQADATGSGTRSHALATL
jgi:hypothetical protein